MDKKDHLEYLEVITENVGKGLLTHPKAEGAFYFGEFYTWDEYVKRYKEECVKEGWINIQDK